MLARYYEANAKDAATATSALRALLGGDAEKAGIDVATYLATTPVRALIAKFTPDGARYTDETIADLKSRDLGGDSHLKVYPRGIRRLLTFAEQIGFLAPRPTTELLPSWKAILAHVAKLVPTGIDDLRRYREAGCTTILGRYPIDHEDIKEANKDVACIRSAMNVLAKNASAEGISVEDFGDGFIGTKDFAGIKSIAPRGVAYYYARESWNNVGKVRPELALPFWPKADRIVSLKPEKWHPLAWKGMRAGLFGENQASIRRTISNANYEATMTQAMGLLHSQGIDHSKLIVGILTPRAAAALLYGACPREFWDGESSDESALDFAKRLEADVDLRQRYVEAILAMAGRNDGRAMVMGPFVKLVVEERYREQQYPAARKIVQRVRTINQSYLCLGSIHLDWAEEFRSLNNKLDERKRTTGKAKKKLIYRHPHLRTKMLQALDAYFAELLSPTRERNSTWAVDVRDAVFVTLELLFPLRVSNYANMRLDKHFNRDAYEMTFDEDEVKNRVDLKYAFPEKGPFEAVCKRIDLYLDVARPLLLSGSPSNYFFVPNHAWPTAGDKLREKGLNDVVTKVAKEAFKNVLPAGLEKLNPHAFRHIVATYWIVVKKEQVLAAQFLCDKLQTVLREYSDIIESACEEVKVALEDEVII